MSSGTLHAASRTISWGAERERKPRLVDTSGHEQAIRGMRVTVIVQAIVPRSGMGAAWTSRGRGP
jgi:hypothetical protein